MLLCQHLLVFLVVGDPGDIMIWGLFVCMYLDGLKARGETFAGCSPFLEVLFAINLSWYSSIAGIM